MSTQEISGNAMLAGVMGWPVGHSKSPRLHGYWLRHYGIDGTYVPLAVQPERIEQALRALPVLGFRGCNLTIPHKELAVSIVDEIDPVAKRVGAVNTIVVKPNGELAGRNTDVAGFSQNLISAGFVLDTQNPTATVLGAGGAARAIVVALQDMGLSEIRIVNRDQARAEALTRYVGGAARFVIFDWSHAGKALEGSGLVVNSTSLGMTGQPPLEIDLSPMDPKGWVTDAVYAPLETSLLVQAKKKGLRCVDGLGMLLYQAAPGFEAWFGIKPEVTPALREHMLSA